MVGALLVRHDAASAALVRHQLARDLASYDLPTDTIENAILVASELVGNAIRHTSASDAGTLDVSWDVDEKGVLISVGDSSEVPPVARLGRADEPGGRGLRIVAAVTDDWGVEPAGRGKRVWAHVPTKQDASVS
jgi:two-component sensor histidine kinase